MLFYIALETLQCARFDLERENHFSFENAFLFQKSHEFDCVIVYE